MARRMNIDAATIGLWRLDESGGGASIDVGTNGLNGTNNGSTAVAVADMPFAYARTFVAASSQYISVPDNAALRPATAVSIAAWVRPASFPAAFMNIAGRMNPGTEGYSLHITNTTTLGLGVQVDGSSYAVDHDISGWTPGDWHFVVGTFESNLAIVYIDGYEVTRATGWGTNITYSGTVPFDIGHFPAGSPVGYFDGDIAEVHVLSRVLQPWEILNTYLGASDPQSGFTVDPTYSEAVYNFNNPSEGATVYDDTGTHNGSVTGSMPLNPSAVSEWSRYCGTGTPGNYISIPHAATFNDLTIDRTWELWAYSTNVSASWQQLIIKGPVGYARYPILIGMSPGGPAWEVLVNDGSVVVRATSPHTPVANHMYHVAAVWEAAPKRVSLYVDGSLADSDENLSLNPAAITNTNPLYISRSDADPWIGYVSAVAVTNRAKTPDEIYNTYHGTNLLEEPWA